jgi:hypothetical protein
MTSLTLVLVAVVAALVKLTVVVGLLVLRRRRLTRRGPSRSAAAPASQLDAKWFSAPRRI